MDFDQAAAGWDTQRRQARAVVIAEEIRHQLGGLAPRRAALEFGCGTGLIGGLLADCFDTVVLMDNSPAMMKQAETRARGRACAPAEAGAPAHTAAPALAQGPLAKTPPKAPPTRPLGRLLPLLWDLTAAPYPQPPGFPPVFDGIFSSMALHHVADVEALARRFLALLRPGGRVCLVDLCPDAGGAFHAGEADFTGHHGFAPEAFAALLGRAGFEQVWARVFYHGEKPVAGRLVPYRLFCAVAVRPAAGAPAPG